MTTEEEIVKRLDAIETELKELALNLRGEGKLKFKHGDYISVKLSNAQPIIGIYSELLSRGRDCGMICSYQNFLTIVPYVCNEMYPVDVFSFATEKQKAELDNHLAKAGKRYNPRTLELEDIIKEGDLVVVINPEACKSTITVYDKYTIGLMDVNKSFSVIKWDGTKEQYERILRGEEK